MARSSGPTRRAAAARRRLARRLYPDPSERPDWLEGRLLRAGEVATLLQVSRRSVAAWARRGLLPSIETPGGHRRFRAADVRALIGSLKRVAETDILRCRPGASRVGPAQQSKYSENS